MDDTPWSDCVDVQTSTSTDLNQSLIMSNLFNICGVKIIAHFCFVI